MIKITGYGFQADRVSFTIEFDLNGETKTHSTTRKMNLLLAMTADEIKDLIRQRVTARRGELMQSDVQALLDPLVDMDLETV